MRTEGEAGKIKSYTLFGLLLSCIKFSLSAASRHIFQNVIQDTAASISLSETDTQKQTALINASGQMGSQDDLCCSRDITLAEEQKSRSFMPCHYKLGVKEVLRTPFLAAAG